MKEFGMTNTLEAEIDQMAGDIIDALVRKAQEQCAAADQTQQTKSADTGTVVNRLICLLGFEHFDKYEAVELEALIFYAAKKRQSHETVIHNMVLQKFGIGQIAELQRNDFMRVRNYLVDTANESSAT